MFFLPALFSLALFSSAFLSFSVQPILGKMLLPMVGGAPAGWIVAMAFFQIALLGGYGLSYFLGRFSPWIHALGLLAIYAIGFLFLPPVLLQIGNVQGIELSAAVVVALFKTIFIPFLALTATTAALQRVFAATKHPTARDPYYLFVASNVGSFAGLLIYPFVLEPLSGLAGQTALWQGIYIVAVALIIIACVAAWMNRAVTVETIHEKENIPRPSAQRIFRWTLLAFVPCSLSMGATTLITTDIGGLPLFWVLPLGLYLLTFILAFSSKPLVLEKNVDFYHIVGAAFMILFLGLEIGYQPGGPFIFFVMLATLILGIFFMISWMCHRRLADDRPATQHLTLFYFVIALGGGLAGMLHAFVLPYVLSNIFEFPLVVILSILLIKPSDLKVKNYTKQQITMALNAMLVVSVVFLMAGFYAKTHGSPSTVYKPLYFVFMFVALLLSVKPRYMMIVGMVVLVTSINNHYRGEVLETGRNFFGARAVYDVEYSDKKMTRVFVHGNTVHGMEVLGDDLKKINYGYYGRNGTIQDALDAARAKTIAVVGLGAGQLACYAPTLKTDFYEIDPDVEHTARKFFHYLETCPPRDVIIGDGRLMLAEKKRQYDLLLLDAFTSDGVPMHLLTKDAFQAYRKRVTKDGVILFHVSNRYLNLTPPLAAVAESEGLTAYQKLYVPPKTDKSKLSSFWVAVPVSKKAGAVLKAKGWKQSKPMDHVWTDDHSSLLDAFDLRGAMAESPESLE